MKRFSFTKSTSFVLAISLSAMAAPGPTPDEAQQRAEGTQSNVIVILRDQMAHVAPARRAMSNRASALASSQNLLISELQQGRRRAVRSFSTINAFATRMSAEEAAHLATHPEVLAVVPDLPIRGRKLQKMPFTTPAIVPSPAAIAQIASSKSLCNTLEPEALQLTNTAFANPSVAQAQSVLDGNGIPVTGVGVKVAYIADGLDPTVGGFTRPDGSNVFVDYQDFTGDPAGTATGGAEAFGDAASIAAQDLPNGRPLVFDISRFGSVYKLPTPCNIRVRGMAPGASLVGLNVFSAEGFTTTSTFVQAIEWAVVHDDVDVINESFGGNPFPDTDTDPISLADAAAVKAGVTVVVSTGDAGTAGTLGSPGTDPAVISVGATNSWRIYAQTHGGVIPLTPHEGVINNNISALSSGGFAQHLARTVDVVAPGDSGWALCSANTTLYPECTDINGQPSPVQTFGGTSESSPLTAGEAALVIQAYRSTHRGSDPSPALVRRIIMSSATDLGVPSQEQGAGLINSLAAVNLALSIDDGGRQVKGRGSVLLAFPNSTLITDVPGSRQVRTYEITNPGTTPLQFAPALESLTQVVAGNRWSLSLDPSRDPIFVNSVGAARPYIKQTFRVPAGVQHLDAAIAYQSDPASANSPLVLFALLDPSGRQAADSLPQGTGNGYGHVDVANPAAGVWSAIIWTRPVGVDGSYNGLVQFEWKGENYEKLGAVSPQRVILAPGQSQTVIARFSMPAEPGDFGAAIRLHSFNATPMPEIPVSLRTLVPTTRTGGSFTGTLTGGNGRKGAGPTQTFEFEVPAGIANMGLTLDVPDPGYLLEGVLVDPNGMQVSVQPSVDPNGTPVGALQMFKNNPQPGRWQFVLLTNFFSSGNQTSLPFSARIEFDGARIFSADIPQSTNVHISASRSTPVLVHVTNTGAVTEAYFADPRLTAPVTMSLQAVRAPTCGTGATQLPGKCAQFILPPETTSIQFTAEATAPIEMDAANAAGFLVGLTGSPDIFAKNVNANAAVASLTQPVIPWGLWNVQPSLIGPYNAVGALPHSVSLRASATLKKFDTTMSSDTGDAWAAFTLGFGSVAPLTLGPGESGTIRLKIRPSAADVGKSVTGYLYIDTFNSTVGTGDEVMRIPYAYTVVE